ncbi:MAG TPA: PAS domain S-box/diguanylate cyclase (GGDEF) domain-containing protein [Rhodospirillaceae bacterium]|nr:PAS domain S-box/diguanylate cyclase (GGDEF) domain-containing protein [Rhodospirillaceae bacterium]HAT34868.1 PAS domain S-box/diguanylate cyclase (GGDEF) domain-containing protein [Rhodospirillaceae bacterium]
MDLRKMNVMTPENSAFSTVFRHAGLGMAILDEAVRIVDVNPALQNLFGRSAEELLGLSPSELLNPESSTGCQQLIDEFFTGTDTSLEYDQTYTHANGQKFSCMLEICRTRDEGGPMIIALFDVSSVNSTSVRQAEKRYRGLFENAVEGIFQSTPCGRYLAVNPALATKLGYESPEDLIAGIEDISSQIYVDSESRREFEQMMRTHGTVKEFESEVYKKDGSKIWVTESARAVLDASGKISYFEGRLEDITKRKHAEEELQKSVFHDGLTGLPNREFFMDRLSQMIARSKRRGNSPYAVMFLDGDRFKRINDSLGHIAGDQLLMSLSTRLKDCLREEDTLARLGGDEFGILLEDIEDPDFAIVVAERIEKALDDPFTIEDQEIVFGVSIGIAIGQTHYEDPTAPLRDADIAMYESKAKGRQRYTLFDPTMGTRAAHMMQMENDLRTALDKNQFTVFYQPIMALDGESISGFEALIRWQHPEQGLLGPDKFIGIAEDTGMITEIGDWILHEACRQIVAWQKEFENDELTISINLSPEQLNKPDIVTRIWNCIADTKVRPACVKLEITESTIMRNPNEVRKKLESLREIGLRFSIDDFGTGYSSLAQLGQFPVDILKIDRSFISAMGDPDGGIDIVRTILELGKALGMEVIAEGVETECDQSTLQTLECPYAQGFLFSRPIPESDVRALLSVAQ